MFNSAAEIKTYALAGHATVTLTSQRTGARYTYRVNRAKDRETGEPTNRWFVALLTGPDNESDYTYLGVVDGGGDFRLTGKSKLAADAPPVRGFAYMWGWIQTGLMPPQLEVRHEGHCGRCGRTLTVPESIDRGIGPECSKMMGV